MASGRGRGWRRVSRRRGVHGASCHLAQTQTRDRSTVVPGRHWTYGGSRRADNAGRGTIDVWTTFRRENSAQWPSLGACQASHVSAHRRPHYFELGVCVRTLPLYSYHVRLDIRQALWGTIVSYNAGLRASLVFHLSSPVILNAEFGLLDLTCLFDGGCDWSDNHLNSTEVHSSVLDCIGKRAQ